jgi:hypothetical protein
MSQTELDQLFTQLSSEDAKARRSAAQRLGQLKQPEAISRLANVYTNDEDETVRKAAADALRVFRRMEQSDDEEVKTGLSSETLFRIRTVLLITLALTVFANVGLLVSRLLPQPGDAQPIQTAVTPRDELVKAFSKRIEDARDDTNLLRRIYSGIQGLGIEAIKVNREQCAKLAGSQVSQVALGNLDSITYPDLREVNELINAAVLKIFPLRNSLNTICTLTNGDELKRQLDAFGGADKLVRDTDDIKNKDLAAADAGLQKAINSPAATVGPTFTPTATNTPLPTITPSPAPPTATVPTNTPVPTQGPTSTPTTAVSPTLPAVTFNGTQLDTLTSYKFSETIKIEGKASNGRAIRGSATITGSRKASPLTAQYEVSISDTNPPSPLFKSTFGTYSIPGRSSYYVLDGVLYQTGDVTKTVRPVAECQAFRTADDQALRNAFGKLPSSDLTLALAPAETTMNGVAVQHYHGEKKDAQQTHTVDLWLSTDGKQLPIKIVDKVTMTSSPQATLMPGVAELTITTEYNLQGQDVTVTKPLICNKATPK